MAEAENPKVRKLARENIAATSGARARRATLTYAPMLLASASPAGKKHRLVYDAKHGLRLPGKLVRKENQPRTGNAAVDEAYKFTGQSYDFYFRILDRNSLDNRGMVLSSSVHYRRSFANAYWDGSQMVFGDGDGTVFQRLTRSIDVVAHELTHGVVTFTANLEYQDEPGALNEHFADVFGTIVRQWSKRQSVSRADWLIGSEILMPAPTRKAIRSMSHPGTAFKDDPYLGTDPQPAHRKDKYTGYEDNGGVHINSGIPNRAFYLAATALGGRSWDKAALIWYKALLTLTPRSDFADCAGATANVAGSLCGKAAQTMVRNAWKQVGV